jgi:osmotically-inducible protein OsmY
MPRPLPFYVAAAVGGAALAYYMDPRSGRRRRHLARDKALHYARQGGRRGRRLVRHATSDLSGVAQRVANRRIPHDEAELDDATLVDRVESIVFRSHDIPKGQININAEKGVVFLRGEVDRPELLEELETRVRKVRGVRGVENKLHIPKKT